MSVGRTLRRGMMRRQKRLLAPVLAALSLALFWSPLTGHAQQAAAFSGLDLTFSPTSTGGTRNGFFAALAPVEECEPYSYSLQATVAYGAVTASSIYVKNITFHFWINQGYVFPNDFTWFNKNQTLQHGSPSYFGKHYTVPVGNITYYINQTWYWSGNEVNAMYLTYWIYKNVNYNPNDSINCVQYQVLRFDYQTPG